MYQLDKIDRKILFELDFDSRQSDSKIAKKLKISRDIVRYRINKLIELDYIHNFITIINSMKLGYNWYRTFFKFENLTIIKEKEIIEYLKTKSSWITKIEGKWSLNTGIFIKNVYEFKEFIDEFLFRYSSYVKDYETSIVTKMYIHHKNYLIENNSNYQKPILMGFESYKDYNEVKIDKVDFDILKVILKNARLKTIDIAKQINLTEIVVRYRLKKMIKSGIILGFKPFLNVDKLGFIYFKLHLKLYNLNIDKKKKFMNFLFKHLNVVYTTELINGSDLEIEFQVNSNSEFYKYIENIRNEFGDIIKDYEFMQYTNEYKFTYLPNIF